MTIVCLKYYIHPDSMDEMQLKNIFLLTIRIIYKETYWLRVKDHMGVTDVEHFCSKEPNTTCRREFTIHFKIVDLPLLKPYCARTKRRQVSK